MTRKPKLGALRWLWLLLLPLPSIVGYAESGDPLGAMSEISNRAAKGDRLPIAHPVENGWTSCAPAPGFWKSTRCAVLDAQIEFGSGKRPPR